MKRALLLVPVMLVACKTQIDADKLVSTIKEGTAAKHLELATLDCPKGREAKQGDNFLCTGTTADGQKVTIKVDQLDNAGNVKWELQGMILDTAKVKAVVEPKLGSGAAIDCPHPVSVMAIGETTQCKVSQNGATSKLEIKMEDAQGNITYKVDP